MAVHLRTLLPAVTITGATITVGDHVFPSSAPPRSASPSAGATSSLLDTDPTRAAAPSTTSPGAGPVAQYVLLARIGRPGGGRPVFLLAGQTALTNLAAARYLVREQRALSRAYHADQPFCLVLRVTEPAAYGTDFVELAADVSAYVG
jgi:hypothetical protein